MKALKQSSGGTTNLIKVVPKNAGMILFCESRGNLSTYFQSDRSGLLRKAFVNDFTIAEAGLTNLAAKAAAAGFEAQKQFWIRQTAKAAR